MFVEGVFQKKKWYNSDLDSIILFKVKRVCCEIESKILSEERYSLFWDMFECCFIV